MKKKSEGYKREELKVFLQTQMDRFAKTADDHQWPWEIRRWHELAFCLATVIACPPLSASRIRVLIFLFADLGLLDITPLAAYASGKKDEKTGQLVQTAVFLLEREGLPTKEAQRVMTTIAEAAAVLNDRFGGKVQRYLRLHGELLLKDLDQKFSFSELEGDQRRLAFTIWIQNVLNMPVGASLPAVRTLCKEFNVTEGELHEAVDELGINLALLDDVVTEMDVEGRPT